MASVFEMDVYLNAAVCSFYSEIPHLKEVQKKRVWFWRLRVLLKFILFAVFQVVVSSFEAASPIIIEFDMDNSIFGLPREFVVASAGKHVYGTGFCNQCWL